MQYDVFIYHNSSILACPKNQILSLWLWTQSHFFGLPRFLPKIDFCTSICNSFITEIVLFFLNFCVSNFDLAQKAYMVVILQGMNIF